MGRELKLTEIIGHALRSSDNESSSSIKGYFRDFNIASIKAKGAGWRGSDGEVITVTLYTDGEKIYNVSQAGDGQFQDVKEIYRQETIENIKKKLTPEELKLIGL